MPNFNFTSLVAKYAVPVEVTEETDGFYDHDNGGKWTANTQTRTINVAIFNMNARDVRGMGMTFGEGGTYTTEDIKIYVHEQIAIGASLTWKGNAFTVKSQIDHSDYANGLRIYVARRADRLPEVNNDA